MSELLRDSQRSAADLEDTGNWISEREMNELWERAELISGDPEFARHAGEEGLDRLGSSTTLTVLRGLGSPEELFSHIEMATRRFNSVAAMEPVEVSNGFAEVRATAEPGFDRHLAHCEWTRGMLSQAPTLFGFPAATVEHPSCICLGAPACLYRVAWESAPSLARAGTKERERALEGQLETISARLKGVLATATELISAEDKDEILSRLVDQAALLVGAPAYVIELRLSPSSPVRRHRRGLSDAEAGDVAETVHDLDPAELPEHWLAVELRSKLNAYGVLVAMYEPGDRFFDQERELLEMFGRYAATTLDSAAALQDAQELQREAQKRYEDSHLLLELARRIATAETSQAVAQRLAEALPTVVECDRVSVYIWEESSSEFVRQAVAGFDPGEDDGALGRVRTEDVPHLAELVKRPDPEPLFVDLENTARRASLERLGVKASALVPIVTKERLLGCVILSTRNDLAKLEPSPELRHRLAGIAAHAVTALDNGRLVDGMMRQAREDSLTGLLNRMGFKEALGAAAGRMRSTGGRIGLFFIDLDDFKAVNDELGHEVGDLLLVAVGRRLRAQLAAGCAVARVGGDEFVVLAAESPGEGESPEAVDACLRGIFAEPFELGGRQVWVGASLGRAVWPLEADDPEQLLRLADKSMYAAKKSRKSL